MPETQNIEYKSSWHDEFSCKVSAYQTCLSLSNCSRKWRETQYLKWICGFANNRANEDRVQIRFKLCRVQLIEDEVNAQGGRVYIGKDDVGNVVGVDDYKTPIYFVF